MSITMQGVAELGVYLVVIIVTGVVPKCQAMVGLILVLQVVIINQNGAQNHKMNKRGRNAPFLTWFCIVISRYIRCNAAAQ